MSRTVPMASPSPYIEQILSALPHLRRGTGGVAAVIRDGEVLGKRAWGYANIDKRIPMTTQTVFPICSISKQMVCLAYTSLLQDPTPHMLETKQAPRALMDAELKKLLPHLTGLDKGLEIHDLFNMQSGIRDYWAMTTLWGAHPEGQFSLLDDAPQALDRLKSFHFAPGTEYSYSNVNFHVLGRIMENVSGQSLSQLLSTRVFIPAKMSTASLNPNTFGLPLPIVGYEGNEKTGYFPATNRIEWAGDAGIAASLEDMIAYEQYLDTSLQTPSSPYATNSTQQTYRDGKPARYGYGLARFEVAGQQAIGHGGALRGFRHSRLQIPSLRISVVVLLNSELPPGAPAVYILKQLLSHPETEPEPIIPGAEWKADFLDPETKLAISISGNPDPAKPGSLSVSYGPGTGGEIVTLKSPTTAASDDTTLRLEGDTLHYDRPDDNRFIRATRIKPPSTLELYNAPSADYVGTYTCAESGSSFTVTGSSGTLYGAFDGFLGRGPVWLMRFLGEDTWLLGNPRGMDSTPPGDWTVIFRRREGGEVQGVTVGCWLARGVEYVRV